MIQFREKILLRGCCQLHMCFNYHNHTLLVKIALFRIRIFFKVSSWIRIRIRIMRIRQDCQDMSCYGTFCLLCTGTCTVKQNYGEPGISTRIGNRVIRIPNIGSVSRKVCTGTGTEHVTVIRYTITKKNRKRHLSFTLPGGVLPGPPRLCMARQFFRPPAPQMGRPRPACSLRFSVSKTTSSSGRRAATAALESPPPAPR